MSYLIVFTTVPALKEARRLADVLLSRKLAACVHIAPAGESRYFWKGRREVSKEHVLWIKTKAALFARLEKTIRSLHSYEVPEIIAIPVKKGSAPYLSWISKQTRS